MESPKIHKNGTIHRPCGAQATFLNQKTSAAPRRVQGVLDLKLNQSRNRRTRRGLSPPYLPAGSKTGPLVPTVGFVLLLDASKFRIIFLHRFWSILFPSFFDRKTFTMGPGRPLDRPKSLLNDFSIDFGSILEPIFHEKCLKQSMHFSCLKKS